MLYFVLGLILLVILAVVLFLFLEFSVILSVKKGNLEFRIKVLGIQFKIPLGKKNDHAKHSEEESEGSGFKPESEQSIMKRFMDFRNEFTREKEAIKQALSYLRHKICIYETAVLGDFGTGNAATTGIAYGSIQAFFGAISALVGQFFALEKPTLVNVDLNFEKPVFNLSFHAILKARPIYLLKGFLIYNKNRNKNGR